MGYGDYAAGTQAEYVFAIVLEFTGVAVMSVLMYIVGNIASSGSSYHAQIDQKFSDLELWVTRLEKCNQPKHLQPRIQHGITTSLQRYFRYNFNQLVNLDRMGFYEKLPPRMQTELVQVLFKDFISKFDHFFEGLEQGFLNEMIINMYARTFTSGEEIYKQGQKLDEIVFVIKGGIAICEPKGIQEPFCIYPT